VSENEPTFDWHVITEIRHNDDEFRQQVIDAIAECGGVLLSFIRPVECTPMVEGTNGFLIHDDERWCWYAEAPEGFDERVKGNEIIRRATKAPKAGFA
jgi:hypothetical protein